METCPITGEPLLNPGQTVSHTAINTLTNQMRSPGGLASLMQNVDAALSAKPDSEGRRGTKPTSSPPLNLALLERVDDHRDTIQSWAYALAQHVNPGIRFKHGDWQYCAAIFVQLAPKATTWEQAPTMIDELGDALKQLERAIKREPTRQLSEPEKEYAAGALLNRQLTITPAIEAVRLLTGTTLNPATVRSWKHRGHITTQGDPPRYLISDLLEHATAACDKITTGE